MNYPKHLSDPTRLAMAAELTQKELRKLLPSVSEPAWPRLDQDVANWVDGKASELAPLHDFWNGCEGITQGFKLKRVIRYISAENIRWERVDMKLDDIPLGWRLPSLKPLGNPPYTAAQIRQALADDPKLRADNLAAAKQHATSSVPRDHYPIFVIRDRHDKTTLLDGNRRMVAAILADRPTIPAYLGQVDDYHTIRNYWISTPLLRNLVRVAETADDPAVTTGVTAILRQLFAETEVARINYQHRVCSQSPLAQQLFDELTQAA